MSTAEEVARKEANAAAASIAVANQKIAHDRERAELDATTKAQQVVSNFKANKLAEKQKEVDAQKTAVGQPTDRFNLDQAAATGAPDNRTLDPRLNAEDVARGGGGQTGKGLLQSILSGGGGEGLSEATTTTTTGIEGVPVGFGRIGVEKTRTATRTPSPASIQRQKQKVQIQAATELRLQAKAEADRGRQIAEDMATFNAIPGVNSTQAFELATTHPKDYTKEQHALLDKGEEIAEKREKIKEKIASGRATAAELRKIAEEKRKVSDAERSDRAEKRLESRFLLDTVKAMDDLDKRIASGTVTDPNQVPWGKYTGVPDIPPEDARKQLFSGVEEVAGGDKNPADASPLLFTTQVTLPAASVGLIPVTRGERVIDIKYARDDTVAGMDFITIGKFIGTMDDAIHKKDKKAREALKSWGLVESFVGNSPTTVKTGALAGNSRFQNRGYANYSLKRDEMGLGPGSLIQENLNLLNQSVPKEIQQRLEDLTNLQLRKVFEQSKR